MVGVETEVVRHRTDEPSEVVRVEFYGVDAADSHSGPEQIGLVVVVDIDVRVEALAPAVLEVGNSFPLSQNLIRSERIVGYPDIAAVSGHVELAVVGAYVRSDGDIGHIVVVPVEHVFGYPCASAGAEHVVLAFPLEYRHVARRASLPYLHGERVAVACILSQGLGLQQRSRAEHRSRDSKDFLCHNGNVFSVFGIILPL